jgi:hypothetical protein
VAVNRRTPWEAVIFTLWRISLGDRWGATLAANWKAEANFSRLQVIFMGADNPTEGRTGEQAHLGRNSNLNDPDPVLPFF